MEFELVSQLIGSLGFPIVCCGYMMVTNNKTIKELTGAVNSLTECIHILMSKADNDFDNLTFVKDSDSN